MDGLSGAVVAVVGMSRSGEAAASLAVSLGAEVVGLDLRPSLAPIRGVRLELGPHRRETLLGADLVVVSPGVPATQPDLVAAAATFSLADAWGRGEHPCRRPPPPGHPEQAAAPPAQEEPPTARALAQVASRGDG